MLRRAGKAGLKQDTSQYMYPSRNTLKAPANNRCSFRIVRNRNT
jgi:hypothetical protein